MNFINAGSIALMAFTANVDPSVTQLNHNPLPQLTRVQESMVFKSRKEDEIELDVPFVHQYHDLPEDRKAQIMWSACGPTSLTMSFKYFGVDTSLIDVIDKLPNDVYVKGVMFYNLKKGAEIYDFEAVDVEKNARGIYNALNEGYPVIINIQNYMGYVGHAMVVKGIKGYNAETGTAVSLLIQDPTAGPDQEFKFLSTTTLEQPEKGFTNYIGTLSPFYIKPK